VSPCWSHLLLSSYSKLQLAGRVPTLSLRHRALPRCDGPSIGKTMKEKHVMLTWRKRSESKISIQLELHPNCYSHIHTCFEIIKTKKSGKFKPHLTYSQKAGAARSARHRCAYEGWQPRCRFMGPDFFCKGCMPRPMGNLCHRPCYLQYHLQHLNATACHQTSLGVERRALRSC
jgi:hypothetical protein